MDSITIDGAAGDSLGHNTGMIIVLSQDDLGQFSDTIQMPSTLETRLVSPSPTLSSTTRMIVLPSTLAVSC
jgi:hypothetical protein